MFSQIIFTNGYCEFECKELFMKNYHRHFAFVFILMTSMASLSAQSDLSNEAQYEREYERSNQVGKEDKVDHLLYLMYSRLGGTKEADRWTFKAFTYVLQYHLNHSWSVEMNVSFRNWSERDKLFVPITLGPSYDIELSEKLSLVPYVGFGPAAVVGNDYSSIFASFNTGARFKLQLKNNKHFIYGVNFGQGMAFHPDSFEFLDLFVGLKL